MRVLGLDYWSMSFTKNKEGIHGPFLTRLRSRGGREGWMRGSGTGRSQGRASLVVNTGLGSWTTGGTVGTSVGSRVNHGRQARGLWDSLSRERWSVSLDSTFKAGSALYSSSRNSGNFLIIIIIINSSQVKSSLPLPLPLPLQQTSFFLFFTQRLVLFSLSLLTWTLPFNVEKLLGGCGSQTFEGRQVYEAKTWSSSYKREATQRERQEELQIRFSKVFHSHLCPIIKPEGTSEWEKRERERKRSKKGSEESKTSLTQRLGALSLEGHLLRVKS